MWRSNKVMDAFRCRMKETADKKEGGKNTMAIKGNRTKKKLSNRAKTKKQALKRRRVRTRKAKGKYGK